MKLFILFSIGAIIGWNIFLIQRDDQMYKNYYQQSAREQMK
jgi:hypothetical protein